MRHALLALATAACGAAPIAPDAARGTDDAAPADAAGPMVDARVCDAAGFGARGDGTTDDTAALQAAIDACDTIALHDGTFLTGTLVLDDDTTLALAPTATLRGRADAAAYPTLDPGFANSQRSNCQRALLYAGGAARIHITGGGTIDGNARAVPAWNGNQIPEAQRPMAIFLAGATDVVIDDVRVRDAGTWAVVLMQVERATIRGITVTTELGPTHDGIDIVDGHDVVIEDVDVTAGDDAICLKSGSAFGTVGVTVRQSRVHGAGVANGVKFGTASVGAFRHIVVEDVAIAHAQAAALAVESVDGAAIADVTFRRITIDDVGTPFFVLLGSRDRDPTRVGSIQGVTFEDITGGHFRYPWGAIITGTAIDGQVFGIGDLTFRNLDLTWKAAGDPPSPTPFTDDNFPEYQGPVPGQPGAYYNRYPDAKFITGTGGGENTRYAGPGYAFFLRHATGVTFAQCRARKDGPDPRPWRDTKDTAMVTGDCPP